MLNVKIKCHYNEEQEQIKCHFLYKDTGFRIDLMVLFRDLGLSEPNSIFNHFVNDSIDYVERSINNRNYNRGNNASDKPKGFFSIKLNPEVDINKFMDELSEYFSNELEDAYYHDELTHPFWTAVNINSNEDLNSL